MSIISTINGLKPEIIKRVSAELHKLKGKIDDYEIAWKQLQDISAKVIIEILAKNLPDTCTLSSPKSKSTYPDIKIETPEGTFAIDALGLNITYCFGDLERNIQQQKNSDRPQIKQKTEIQKFVLKGSRKPKKSKN